MISFDFNPDSGHINIMIAPDIIVPNDAIDEIMASADHLIHRPFTHPTIVMLQGVVNNVLRKYIANDQIYRIDTRSGMRVPL